MRKALVAAVFSTVAMSATADEFKLPIIGNAPDYRLTIVFKNGYTQPSPPATLLHHGGWTKLVEEGPNGRTEFQSPDEDLVLLVFRAKGKPAGLRFRLHQQMKPSEPGEVTDTGEDKKVAGETCRVWKIYRGDRERMGFRLEWFKCLTKDGIVLSSGTFDAKGGVSTSTEATKIERLPLTWADLFPSDHEIRQGLWLSRSDTNLKADEDHSDFEMTMTGESGEQVLRRRHYPWNYEDVREGNGRRKIRIWNELENHGLSISVDPLGHIESAYGRNETGEVGRRRNDFDLVTAPKKKEKIETVLGERCQWFDMSPNVSDAGQLQCQTLDGIPLHIVNSSGWGLGSSYTAIEVKRIKQTLKDFAIPDELWAVKKWGFPF